MTKTPRGPTPSLIGGENGRPRRATAKKLCECDRCGEALPKGCACIDIPRLGGAFKGNRRVCDDCYQKILVKTCEDLEAAKAL